MSESPSVKARSIGRRLFWLLVCTMIGSAAGFAGLHYTGDSAWLLAVPVVVAAGWLVVADPTECMRRKPPGRQPPAGLPMNRNDARDAAKSRCDD